MVEIALPKNSRPTEGKTWPHAAGAREEREYRIYRYNPEDGKNRAARMRAKIFPSATTRTG